jgi:hypothetical protein
MADEPGQRLVEVATAPRHYERPSSRELRSQTLHRLQIGLFGLSAMLLLVGLANIIMDRADLAEEKDDATQEVIAADAEPKNPVADSLADIGVAPPAEPVPGPRNTAEGKPAAAK